MRVIYRIHISLLLIVFLFVGQKAITQPGSTTKVKRITFTSNITKPPLSLDKLSNNNQIINFTLPYIDIKKIDTESEDFVKISIPKFGIHSQIGLPELPTILRYIEIPFGQNLDLDIIEIDSERMTGYKPFPFQQPKTRNTVPANDYTDLEINKEFYQGESVFPKDIIEKGEIKYFGSKRIQDIQINPIRYFPATNELEIVKNIKIKLTFKDINASTAKAPNNINPISNTFENLNKKFILSPSSHTRSGEYPTPPKLLIITHDDFYDLMVQFAEWKIKKGIVTEIIKKSQIGVNSTAQEIKNAIINVYHDSLRNGPFDYLLLVGDIPYMPAFSKYPGIVNDHEYSTIIGNDFLPDIIVGRFSVNTFNECLTYVTKSINYERYPTIDEGIDWYNKATVSASNAYLDNSHGIHITGFLKNAGFKHVDDFRAVIGEFTSYNIDDALENGRSWMFYIGHGTEEQWTTSPVFKTHMIVDVQNQGALPAIVSVTCSNSELNLIGNDCFSERWMNIGHDRGSILILGATDLTEFFYSDTLGKHALIGYINRDARTFGEAMVYGKMVMQQSFPDPVDPKSEKTMEDFLILGDPTIMPWTDIPAGLSVDYPNHIMPGTSEINFNIKANGENVTDALVCLSNSDLDIYEIAYSDSNGNVSLSFTPQETGRLNIVITGYNLYPIEDVIKIDTFTGIGETSTTTNKIKVQPNPFSRNCLISLNDINTSIQLLEIYTVTGKKIRTYSNINSNNIVISRDNLGSGLYFIKIQDSESRLFYKKIVVR